MRWNSYSLIDKKRSIDYYKYDNQFNKNVS